MANLPTLGWSPTKIQVLIPTGLTPGDKLIKVTAGGVVSNSASFHINDTATPAVRIDSLSSYSGNVNTVFSINGSNFGTSQGTTVVKMGTTVIPIGTVVPYYWSDTRITCKVPTIVAGSYNVTVERTGYTTGTSPSQFAVTVVVPPTTYWDIGWPVPVTIPVSGGFLDPAYFPRCNTILKSIATIIYEGMGVYGFSITMVDGSVGVYDYLKFLPLSFLNKFYDYYTGYVPTTGFLSSGTHDSYDLAMLANFVIKRYLSRAIADFWCLGNVSWGGGLNHGFNLAIVWDDSTGLGITDPNNFHTYYYDISLGVRPTLLQPGNVTSLSAWHDMVAG